MSSLSSPLYGEPFVSTRESIAWLPSAPSEDSDVLVLSSRSTTSGTAGATILFLDLRLLLPLGRESKVTWGFAGLRYATSTSPARMRWFRPIGSRDDALVDEGEMEYRDGVGIETGIGLNPATGQRAAYEEIWRDEPLHVGSPYIFVTSSINIEEATAAMAVLGSHALAIAQETENPNTPREFRTVRMHRRTSAVGDTQETVWEIVFSTGNSVQERELKELVGLADQASQYARGSNIGLGNRSWVVWDAGREGTA